MIKLRNCSQEDVEQIVPENTILLGYRGSIAHNMYLDPMRPEGLDDKDLMGVYIAKENVYFGLDHAKPYQKMLRQDVQNTRVA